jgi:hypothetical protein
MSVQTKTEYLLDRVAERLGVPKPAEGFAFSPEPLGLLKGLVDLLADPAAAKKRVGEFADAVSKARDAVETAKRAQVDHDAALAEIADAQERHVRRMADERANHEREMLERERAIAGREQAAADREKEADDLLDELKADRAALDRRLEAIRKAAE